MIINLPFTTVQFVIELYVMSWVGTIYGFIYLDYVIGGISSAFMIGMTFGGIIYLHAIGKFPSFRFKTKEDES